MVLYQYDVVVCVIVWFLRERDEVRDVLSKVFVIEVIVNGEEMVVDIVEGLLEVLGVFVDEIYQMYVKYLQDLFIFRIN